MSHKSANPKAAFSADGRRYALRDLHAFASADSFLFNDLMFMRIDHRGKCETGHTSSGGPFFLQPDATRYSEGRRFAYVRDDETGKFWSAPYDPVQAEPEEFEFAPGPADITWRNTTAGITVETRVAIPLEDTVELWTFTVRNDSRRRRKVSLVPFFPFGFLADLINYCSFDAKLGGIVYDYFPYYVKVEGYHKNAKLKNAVFCAPDRRPTSYEANMNAFMGGGLPQNPAQLRDARLGRGYANFDDGCAAFQYALTLAPGESETVNFVFGPAKDRREMKALKRKYLSKGGVERAIRRYEKWLDARKENVRIDTPDADFNAFVNHWLPRQTLWIGRTLRTSFGPCARNAITDAMGVVYHDAERARYWLTRIWEHQEKSGWIQHGLPFAKDVAMPPINTIPHRDMNVWGPQAFYHYVVETGDAGILDAKIGFTDSREKATLYEHISIGLEWLLRDRTRRGLSRIGQGDWNDPLNMAGHKLKGESVMLTANLAWALDIWAQVADARDDAGRARRYRREADVCRRAINQYAWDGKWYVRGFTDAGKPFGSAKDKEGRVWLNAQGWPIICGAAKGGRRASAVKAVEKYLSTPSGPMLLSPSYTAFRDDIGKITIKNPGIDENGAVYNSGVAWFSYAMFLAGMADEGWKYLRVMLTGSGTNTVKRSTQLPIYIPNFYSGLAVGAMAGESSHSPSTGTAPWFCHVVVSRLFGVRGEFGGLRIDPQLPGAWRRAKISRTFRGATYDIEIRRSRSVRTVQVSLDGKPLRGNLVPVQPKGTRHLVSVTIP